MYNGWRTIYHLIGGPGPVTRPDFGTSSFTKALFVTGFGQWEVHDSANTHPSHVCQAQRLNCTFIFSLGLFCLKLTLYV